MKKLFLPIVLLAFFAPMVLLDGQTPDGCRFNIGFWVNQTSMPDGRARAVSGMIDGKIYSTCGYNEIYQPSAGNYTTLTKRTLCIYDPIADTWDTAGTPIPYYRWVSTPGQSAVDGKLYVVGGVEWESTSGGWLGIPMARVDVYDPLSDSWELKANLPEPLGEGGICSLDGKIYVTGGISGHSTDPQRHKNLFVYDPELDEWKSKADMISGRAHHVSLACKGKIYVFSGNGSTTAGVAAEAYDPEQDQWSEIAPMPYGVFHSSGCVINDEIYLFGGVKHWGQVSQSSGILKYNPDNDEWTIYGYMPEQHWQHTVYEFGGKVYLIGGREMYHTGLEYRNRVSSKVYAYELSSLYLKENLPDVTLDKGETFNLDLSEYFGHQKQESFSINVCTGQDEIVSDSLADQVLYLHGLEAGSDQVHIRVQSGNDQFGGKFNVTVNPATGIADPQATHTDLQLFPNPAGDQLTIQLQKEGPHTYSICTASGQQAMEGILSGSSQTIDLSELDNGMYFIKVNSSERTVIRKFLKLW
jgi:N-acetylneuraminic acid mutarotase